jgi:hypothetical protein
MDCFSAENGKYIPIGNEIGFKGSESSFKNHLAADRGDEILEQL